MLRVFSITPTGMQKVRGQVKIWRPGEGTSGRVALLVILILLLVITINTEK